MNEIERILAGQALHKFHTLCKEKTVTLNQVMPYLRTQKLSDFRLRCIRSHLPERLKTPAYLQCRLEGLL